MGNIRKSEKVVFVAMLLLSAVFACAAGLSHLQQRKAYQVELDKQVLDVTPTEVIGPHPDFFGDPKGQYTLVEFGDYQCPPCHAAYRLLATILPKYGGKIRFSFRNLPLTSIHPLAMHAAIVAETARQKSKFWTVHDALYTSALSNDRIVQVMQANDITGNITSRPEVNEAQAVVDADVFAASKFGLTRTPSFLLCCPNGKVVRLGSLDKISEYIPERSTPWDALFGSASI